MDWVLDAVLRRLVRSGNLVVITARGRRLSFGDGTGSPVTIEFTSSRWQLAVILDPELQLGEAYTESGIVVRQGSISEFLHIMAKNLGTRQQTLWTRSLKKIRAAVRRVFHFNNELRANRNAHHHYDISHEIFELFLDSEMQYSCAYFKNPNSTIEEAQRAKIEHISAKLLLKSEGLRVLDIGCGWGKLDIYLARRHQADVVGINISNEQIRIANRNLESAARKSSEPIHCEFRLEDYRNFSAQEKFDRIVSVGMFEHVGKRYYETFFQKCFDVLADDGVMLLHTIGRWNGAREPNAWVWRHIFPGGYAPSLSEMIPMIERSGFVITDIEPLHMHYVHTLKHWRLRFIEQSREVLRILGHRGDRFMRMWEFYLGGFEASFRYGGLVAFQIQLAKRVDITPLSREYMYPKETQLREAGPISVRRAAYSGNYFQTDLIGQTDAHVVRGTDQDF
jgi:cyclopropane-fatty-acyl-phospholipid synthase